MIKIENLSKSYGKHDILKNINTHIKHGYLELGWQFFKNIRKT